MFHPTGDAYYNSEDGCETKQIYTKSTFFQTKRETGETILAAKRSKQFEVSTIFLKYTRKMWIHWKEHRVDALLAIQVTALKLESGRAPSPWRVVAVAPCPLFPTPTLSLSLHLRNIGRNKNNNDLSLLQFPLKRFFSRQFDELNKYQSKIFDFILQAYICLKSISITSICIIKLRQCKLK